MTPTFTVLVILYSPLAFETNPKSASLSKWYEAKAGLENLSARWVSRTPIDRSELLRREGLSKQYIQILDEVQQLLSINLLSEME